MVKGYNNWDRIRSYRDKWQAKKPFHCLESDWQEEFRKLIPLKEYYQDTFIILSDGDYSGIPAEEMRLSREEWKKLSLLIRREHEATHYFTQRVFGSANNHILDELIADFMGIVAAIGYYRSDWFLRFMGLENYPMYRKGGRLENYLGDPPLSAEAFKILWFLVKKVSENLELIYRKNKLKIKTVGEKAQILMALTGFTFIDLVIEDGKIQIKEIQANKNEF